MEDKIEIHTNEKKKLTKNNKMTKSFKQMKNNIFFKNHATQEKKSIYLNGMLIIA